MNCMAIEDGPFPLAYVTHTIKYLQQCKFSCSIKMLTNNSLNYLSLLLKSHENIYLSRCCMDVGHAFGGVTSTRLYCYTNGGSLLWHGGSNERKREQKQEARRRPTSTLPHLALPDVGTVLFLPITFLEDKAELKSTSSRSHISPKHTPRHPKCVTTEGDSMRIGNKCAIVVTACALVDTTDCN